ncbi:ABC transporter ATP-binding protein [Paraburkholderia silviterrae]|uniref:ABC transporter ATP-binding protein n=1 Tax=Paraburkholderia silviterrae TaxID=2528715 RepID=A0A4R5MGT2_9BURK|nr:ABC transporter ATP-binding protein [Paraburkholderia silviterrae]TDG25980.1 ABC transporter ATP-binding protein [Paraburkholderia silviterrae]
MIEFDHVSRRFGETAAVDRVSLAIARGSITALVGASGSGKSTLLRMINRLIAPDEGAVRIDGANIATLPEVALRRGIGYVIQGNGLFPHWTVARNIATVPRLLGWDAARIEARVRELLERFGLDPAVHANKLPHALSGGQQQRVGVARALAAEPQILLMDEPFGALDPIIRARAQDDLLALQRRLGITIVIVTHDMDEALRLGDQIVVMERGRVLQAGTPQQILARPATDFVGQLIGDSDRALRLLALTPVAEAAEPGEAGGLAGTNVSASDTLRDAMGALLWHGLGSLPVTDEDGVARRRISLSAIVARARRPL